MTKINLHEVKSRLSHYARLVKSGETIILCDRNKPFAEIRPLPDPAKPAPKRQLGLMNTSRRRIALRSLSSAQNA